MIRAASLVLLASALLIPSLPADDGWVGDRSGTSINRFDTATNTEQAANSPLTVGTTPIDMAQNNADGADPTRVFVVNYGSNDVTVIDRATFSVVQTIDGSTSSLGALDSPSGIVRAQNSTIGATLALVDGKVVGGGRSTIRFLNPANGAFDDEFQDMSPSALYVDVAFSSNGRFWVADTGDQGVMVMRMDGQSGPPFGLGSQLIFNGPGEFADFIFDGAATPTYLLAPQRVATDGTYVVVTDAASPFVTVISANYASEGSAIIANVDCTSLGATTTRDVVIVNSTAYVTTDVAGVGAVAYFDLPSVTNATVPTAIPGLATASDGIGALSDGSKVYVGEASGGAGTITEIDPATNTVGATVPNPLGPLAGPNLYPFAFLFTGAGAGSGGITPGFDGTNLAGDGGHSCEAGTARGTWIPAVLLVAVLGLALLRRRPV